MSSAAPTPPPNQQPSSSSSSSTPSSTRARGRGKSRGGLGKYLRAQGRGRGRGRPAQFTQRLVLEGEQEVELDDEEERELQKELRSKYGRRRLGTNADRYAEPEAELGSDGEPVVEPEVDISTFLERQRISDDTATSSIVQAQAHPEDDDEEVDHSLDHILPSRPGKSATAPKKGKVSQIEWDEDLEELAREKAASEAKRDLKERFKVKADKIRHKPLVAADTKPEPALEAPPLPTEPLKSEKAHMEDFLDDLLG